MKSKYIMINGLAFSEESDMEKLKEYAKEGWILEGIAGGFFYKLKKDTPQDIVYSLDYQREADEEYFAMFKEAGWKLITSIKGQMHIFMAQAGAKPIYSDCESEIDKYIDVRNQTKKGSIYSLLVAIILISLLIVSAISIRSIFIVVLGLLIIDIWVFTFNFMPYLAFNSRIKKMKNGVKGNGKVIGNKILWKINAILGVMLLGLGILYLFDRKYFAILFMVLGIYGTVSSLSYYKEK